MPSDLSQIAGSTGTQIGPWRDKKRYLWLMGLIAPTALFVCCRSCGRSTSWAGMRRRRCRSGSARSCSTSCCPRWTSLRARRAEPARRGDGAAGERQVLPHCTYIFIPFQYASVIFGAYLFTASDLSWLGFDGWLGWPAKIGLALSVGMLGGIGINTAHELGHKKDALERWLSKITLAQTCYGHFYIEHNRGHHVRVATPRTRVGRASARRSGSSCRAACGAA